MVTAEIIEKAHLVIRAYAQEGKLKSLCEIYGLHITSFFQARLDVPLIEDAYNVARKAKADILADEIPDIADTELNPHRARIRCDARRWACAVFNRQVYGDKVDMTITERIDITSALLEARTRVVRPIGDLLNTQKREVVETTTLSIPGSTDLESDDPTSDPENIDPFS